MVAKALIWFVLLLIFFCLALVGNFMFAQKFLLRLESPTDPIREIRKNMAAIKQPVVFRTGGYGNDGAIRQHFIETLHIPEGHLPLITSLLVDISYVAKAN